MSTAALNKEVAKVLAKGIMEIKLQVVDDLCKYLDCADAEFNDMIAKFRANLKEEEEQNVKLAGKKSKKGASASSDVDAKKRQPSAFNLFISDIMPSIAAENPDKAGHEKMTLASGAWKTHPMGVFIESKFKELRTAHPDKESMTNQDLYAQAKEEYIKTGGEVPISKSDSDTSKEKKVIKKVAPATKQSPTSSKSSKSSEETEDSSEVEEPAPKPAAKGKAAAKK